MQKRARSAYGERPLVPRNSVSAIDSGLPSPRARKRTPLSEKKWYLFPFSRFLSRRDNGSVAGGRASPRASPPEKDNNERHAGGMPAAVRPQPGPNHLGGNANLWCWPAPGLNHRLVSGCFLCAARTRTTGCTGYVLNVGGMRPHPLLPVAPSRIRT